LAEKIGLPFKLVEKAKEIANHLSIITKEYQKQQISVQNQIMKKLILYQKLISLKKLHIG